MRILIAAAILVAAAAVSAAAPPVMPDLKKTPGMIDQKLTAAMLCNPRFRTGAIRNVTLAMKRQVFAEYGITRDFGSYEIDHLISLEIGGANDVRNLWPQPYCPLDGSGGKTCFGAREKDHVENWLHRQVCSGSLTLSQAQAMIVKDWFAVYRQWAKAKTQTAKAGSKR